MTPSAPSPKSSPRMGKKRLKKVAGQPTSERMSTMAWKMISRRLRTAQNAPAGWLGTVLPLCGSEN